MKTEILSFFLWTKRIFTKQFKHLKLSQAFICECVWLKRAIKCLPPHKFSPTLQSVAVVTMINGVCVPWSRSVYALCTGLRYNKSNNSCAIQYRTADNSTSAELNQYQYLLSVSMKTEQYTNITFTNVPQWIFFLEKPFSFFFFL